MKNLLSSLAQILFPSVCICCGDYLSKQETGVCDLCMYQMPRYEEHHLADSGLSKKFWGRINVEWCTSFLHFKSESSVRQVLHQIKYKSNLKLGTEMGRKMAIVIADKHAQHPIDAIVPVPLHPKKKNLRGYNQSDLIATGLAESLGIPVWKDVIVRQKHNATQTKKGRYERYVNSKEIFSVVDPRKLEGKQVLLIDDVITTGATIEACGGALLQVKDLRLCIAALAVAT